MPEALIEFQGLGDHDFLAKLLFHHSPALVTLCALPGGGICSQLRDGGGQLLGSWMGTSKPF